VTGDGAEATDDALFRLEFEVRDYECDLQGIVNHATYLNYLEHARHQFLLSLGLDFADLHRRGHSLVVTRCEVDYLAPLVSGDRFVVSLQMSRQSRLRFAFDHGIQRLGDGLLILRARIVGTCLATKGRPSFPPEIERLFES
jgi:acyl-CoA thioester hydrolase